MVEVSFLPHMYIGKGGGGYLGARITQLHFGIFRCGSPLLAVAAPLFVDLFIYFLVCSF